jgi:LPXTG-site transpeptidase (sortase) family protein
LKSNIRILIGILVCLAGAAIFLYPSFREWRTQQEIKNVVEIIESVRSEQLQMSDSDAENSLYSENYADCHTSGYQQLYEEMLRYNEQLVSNGQEISDAFGYEDSPVEFSLDSYGITAIGYIDIPSINCSLPLFIGASQENLSHGAAVLGNTSMPIGGEDTNCVIAAHRGYMGSAFFRDINSIGEGDLIYISNLWETIVYKAVSMQITDPSDAEVLEIVNGKDMLTLISCHPYMIGGGSDRYIVRCERVYIDEAPSAFGEVQENEVADDMLKDDQPLKEASEGGLPDQQESFIMAESLLRVVLPAGVLVIVISIILFRKKHKKQT